MNTANRDSWDWQQLASLGEDLRNKGSLGAQRDGIIAMAARLMDGTVDVWLNEKVFRLPDWKEKNIFPPQPTLDGMKQAIKNGKLFTRQEKSKSTNASFKAFAAIPLEDHDITLGALQITRPKGPAFSREELNLLQALSQIVAVSLIASHRSEVEQFRLRQLNLVREVSAQIANVLHLDELSARVTEIGRAHV